MGGLTSGAGAGAGGEAFTGAGVCAGGAFTGTGATKQDTWQSLQDLITLRRYRAWQKAQEKIMFKYIELCVDMRRGSIQNWTANLYWKHLDCNCPGISDAMVEHELCETIYSLIVVSTFIGGSLI
ncbi:hypothetical protein AgCh_034968 [Apium graveolens]